MKRKTVALCLVLCLVVMLLGSLAAGGCSPKAGKVIEWHFLGGAPRGTSPPETRSEEMCNWVTQQSGGRLKWVYHGGGELPVQQSDFLKLVGTGSFATAYVCSAYVAGDMPLLSAYCLPFFGSSFADWFAFSFSPELAKIRQAEFKKKGVTEIALAINPPMTLTTKQPIRKVSDFKGVKIRCFGKEMPALFQAVGAVPVSMGIAEVYTALQSGLAEGAMCDALVQYNLKFYEVLKYISGQPLNIMLLPLVINTKEYEALPDDLRELVLEGARVWEEKLKGDAPITFSTAITALQSKGMELINLDPGESEKLVAISKPIWESLTKDDPLAQSTYKIGLGILGY